jgi:60 kDa SS-A/Ro ribonucleoprotein
MIARYLGGFCSVGTESAILFFEEREVMANKNLFESMTGKAIPATNALNEESAPAYQLAPKQALAQYAATGCMNQTFYASAEEQLKNVLALCDQVESEFIARTAIFCRERAFMKDMPALLCAVLSVKDIQLMRTVFGRVINDGKMLRNYVQIMRSGIVGRKSLGTLPKKLVQRWIESRTDEALFCASVGQSPSLADLIKMVHPKSGSASRTALFAYLIDRKCDENALPETVKAFEAFKSGQAAEVPDVPFQMLTSLKLSTDQWAGIARKAPWQMTRMNLNTFARHKVFGVDGMTRLIAERLRNPEAIRKSRVLPYQLMSAFVSTVDSVPIEIREALQDAMEIAIQNVPQVNGKVYVLPDISGSMQSPVTGLRLGATSSVRCVDVAALVASAILRKNPTAEVIPFESKVVPVQLNPRDSVVTNASKLSNLPCGGTNCSARLAWLNDRKAMGDLVFYVSDNESWVDAPTYGRFGGSRTETMNQWARYKERNPNARLVCLDIQPYATSQAVEREDILNIGGFSDQVFEIVAEFAAGRLNPNHWIGVIESVEL